MRVYLAGIGSGMGGSWLDGLISPNKDMRCGSISRGGGGRPYIYDKDFSGGNDVHGKSDPRYPWGGFDEELVARVNMLESFYYVADWQTAIIHHLKSFLLDSGAYTFAYNPKNSGVTIDWDEYLDRYAAYIAENDVSLFFELDIDPIVGHEMVCQMRARLEALTGRQCIPVWHRSRGWDEWLRLCDEYPYVAIGGLATKEAPLIEPHIRRMTKEAHRRGAMVHGLGYTRLEKLPMTGLDSVDSTAWQYGNRGGYLYQWDGRTMQKVEGGAGQRLGNPRAAARHNFMQWLAMAEALEERI